MSGLGNDKDETLDAYHIDELPTERQLPSQPCSMTHLHHVAQIPSVSSPCKGQVILKIAALLFYNTVQLTSKFKN